MTTAYDIAADATNVHKVDDEDLELTARMFVDLLTVAENLARSGENRGSVDHANQFLDYAAEMYMREPLFSNAAVDAYVARGGDLCTLVKQARKRRNEVKVGAWLTYLKRNCMENDREHGRKFVRKAVERACLWMGYSPEETIEYLDMYSLRETGN